MHHLGVGRRAKLVHCGVKERRGRHESGRMLISTPRGDVEIWFIRSWRIESDR